uniref:Ring finger protein 122 n=1 Tax=Malurus cyaneus samueli TaxID=2593467 RepID=A0A8C5TQ21_9PASS
MKADPRCTMPPITFQDLPLNIYMVIFGTGIFIFVLSLIFCCYFISKLRHQAQSERFGYKEVKPGVAPSHLPQQTCAVCLEDFRMKEELGVLPCQHAFHRKCLLKWLEVRCVCPMCNKPMAGPWDSPVPASGPSWTSWCDRSRSTPCGIQRDPLGFVGIHRDLSGFQQILSGSIGICHDTAAPHAQHGPPRLPGLHLEDMIRGLVSCFFGYGFPWLGSLGF